MFYGNYANAKTNNLTFIDLILEPYAVKRLGKTEGSVNCSNKAIGSDPNPGFDKHCYCDADLVYSETIIEEDLAAFEIKRQEKAAEEAEKQAEIERKKAEEEAAAAAKAAAAAIKAAEEAEKKREQEILAAQEAAKKKAEEEAKAA